MAPYSLHRLVFGCDPIGVGNLPPVVDSEGCEDATQFCNRVAAERGLVQEKLEAIHGQQLDKYLREHPPSALVARDRVWVQNPEEELETLGRVWQEPAEIIDRISDSVYRVNHNGVEQDLSVERLKSFVQLHDGRQPPLHYYAERREIHDNSYMGKWVNKHECRRKGANGREKRDRQTFHGAKPWWYVKLRDHARLEWHPAASFLHDITSTWMQYNMQHGLHVNLSHFDMQRVQVDIFPFKWRLGVNLLCSRPPEPEPEPEPEPQPEPQGGSLVDTLRNRWNGGAPQGNGEPVQAANGGDSPFLSLYLDTILM